MFGKVLKFMACNTCSDSYYCSDLLFAEDKSCFLGKKATDSKEHFAINTCQTIDILTNSDNNNIFDTFGWRSDLTDKGRGKRAIVGSVPMNLIMLILLAFVILQVYVDSLGIPHSTGFGF